MRRIYLFIKSTFKARDGLSLMEVVIGLVLVGVLVITFTVSLSAAVAARRIKLKNMAAALADMQLSVLRTYAPVAIPEQTNGSLIGVLYTQGGWQTVVDDTTTSASNTLETTADPASGITSVMPLPNNAYDDFTMTASFKPLSTTPVGWQAGFLFRASDLQNGYRVYLTATSLVLEKIVDGSITELYSDIRVVADDAWQTLSVITTGSSIEVKLNTVSITTESDTTFTTGMAALTGWEGVSIHFDDISIGGTSWDMDSETLGVVPDGWERFGLSDLPGSASGTLTVTELFNDSNFKRYKTEINWHDGSDFRSLNQTTEKAN